MITNALMTKLFSDGWYISDDRFSWQSSQPNSKTIKQVTDYAEALCNEEK